MLDPPNGDPPDPGTASNPAEFTDVLRALRLWAGQPSLRRLRHLGGVRTTADGAAEIDSLPESTMSYVLRGDRPARADFVRSFVTACLRACRREPAEILVQVERWHRAWLAAVGAAAARPTGIAPASAGTPPGSTGNGAGAPRQLPAGPADFVGRTAELAELDRLLPPAPLRLTVATIAGPAGVGKTSLAVHWAQRVQDAFPDGQLYADLRGFGPKQAPLNTATVVRSFLGAFGLPARRIPSDVDERVALYRSVLADKRVLVLLDNARDVAQARPLLPGGQNCLTLVTSRHDLSGLVATPGAHPLVLDLLGLAEAEQLLSARLGADRVAAEPGAVREIIVCCARLPLALATVAARAATHRTFPLTSFHDLMRAYAAEQAQRHDDEADRRRATHRLLDHYLHTAHRCAVLLDPTRDPVTLLPAQPGVLPEEVGDQRQASAWFAAELQVLLVVVHHAAAEGFDDHLWRFAWTLKFVLDRLGYWHELAGVQHAALRGLTGSNGRYEQARIHRALSLTYSQLRRYDDAQHHVRCALRLAEELGDHTSQAHTHLHLGGLLQELGRNREALHHVRRALAFFRAAGHRIGQASALNSIGWCHTLLGNHERAIACCQQALRLTQELGEPRSEASTWDSLGRAYHHLGQHRQAIAAYQQALELRRELQDRPAQARTLARIGDTHRDHGDAGAARAAWQQAVAVLRDLGHPDADQILVKLRQLDHPAEV